MPYTKFVSTGKEKPLQLAPGFHDQDSAWQNHQHWKIGYHWPVRNIQFLDLSELVAVKMQVSRCPP